MIFLLSALLTLSAEASNKVGNGGNVVYCKAKGSQKESLRLLDFYEHGISLKEIESDPVALADKKMKKLEGFAAPLASQYRKRLGEIMNEIELKTGARLTTIDDSHHLFQPSDRRCSVKQIAIRRNNLGPQEKKFLIDKSLWSKLSPVDRAGLLSHEVIYEHFSKLGEEDSTKARRINAMIFSDKIGSESFWAAIKDMQLPIYP